MVRGFNLCGRSAMGALCGVVLAWWLAWAFPGWGWWLCGAPPPPGFALRGPLCGVPVCWGLPLDRLILDYCYIYVQLFTSGSGHTKPFFLGKSYGLLREIYID